MSSEEPGQLSSESEGKPPLKERGIEVHASSYRFSGPLPEPGQLARYNTLIPNGADRIMAMAERQSAHRIEMELLAIRANIRRERRGSWFAFILALVAIAGGFLLIYEGRSTQGLVAIIGSVVTLASVFVYARQQQSKERERKAAAVRSPRLASSPMRETREN